MLAICTKYSNGKSPLNTICTQKSRINNTKSPTNTVCTQKSRINTPKSPTNTVCTPKSRANTPKSLTNTSCAEYSLFYRALLQKRPIILRSLRIVATPYLHRQHTFLSAYIKHSDIYIYNKWSEDSRMG